MIICPPFKLKAVREDFNSLVERLGGKALAEKDVAKREAYLGGLSPAQTDAYHRSHYLWDQHKGNTAKIGEYLDSFEHVRDGLRSPKSAAEKTREAIARRRTAKAAPSRITKAPQATEATERRKQIAESLKAEFARMKEGPPSELTWTSALTAPEARDVPAEVTWRDKRGGYLSVNEGAVYALNRIRNTPGQSIRGLTFTKNNAEQYARRASRLALEEEPGIYRDNLVAVARVLREAASKRDEFALVGTGGPGTRATMRHELTHVAQMALERFFNASPHSDEIKKLPLYENGRLGLMKSGYYAIANSPQLIAHELAAHIAAGQFDKTGLTLPQAMKFLEGYFELIGRTYKADALDRFTDLNGRYQEVRDAVRQKLTREETGRAIEGAGASVRGVPEGREKVAAEIRGEAEREEALAEVDIPLPPAIKNGLSEIARTFIEEGRTNFDELVGEFEDLLGEELFDAVADYLPDIVAVEETALKQTAPREVGDLIEAFSGAFDEGREFKTIVEARQFAGKILGIDVKPGTKETKLVDEALEAGVVQAAREIVRTSIKESEKYQHLVTLYTEQQPNLGAKTSGSVARQAYSTPIPVAYVASRLAGITPQTTVYEPTAGNGALLIEATPQNIIANEIDPDRAATLRATLPDAIVTEENSTTNEGTLPVDVVIANPPFGVVKDPEGRSKEFNIAGKYDTTEIDHAIAWKALETMKPDGRAVLILGGVKSEDPEQRSDAYNGKAKRQFYYTLYNAYNVIDHFTVSGDLYQKQGAGWPIDIIVIDGRGKSQRALPAVDVPRIYRTFDELGEVLNAPYRERGRVDATAELPAPAISQPSEGRPPSARRGRVAEGPEGIRPGDVLRPTRGEGAVDVERGTGTAERGEGLVQPTGVREPAGEPTRAEPVVGRGERAGLREPDVEGLPRAPERAGETAEDIARRQSAGAAPAGEREPRAVGQRLGEPTDRGTQVTYKPASAVEGIGTLVPVNLVTATQGSLQRLQQEVGDLDVYVANRLKYDPKTLERYFSAEQVDALALAIRNMEDGKGFIIGDQTGIGKGRVVAGIIRYALLQKRIPIFVTEKPNLYKDMFRDMTDINIGDIRPLMTNAAQRVPLDDDEMVVLKSADARAHNALLRSMINNNSLGDHNIVFTTYSQMQTIKGAATPRQEFLKHFADGAILIFDESHNAGGSEKQDPKHEDQPDRAMFARAIAARAHGVFYSSATYAKRPSVMDLYFTTDMRLAVNNQVSKLGPAIQEGGVPLQQVVASMLTEAGQYIRRERSFDGINYDTRIVSVNREAAENVSAVMRKIQLFDRVKSHIVEHLKVQLKAEASALGTDASTGATGVHSTNFTSIMHNLIDQMLLSLKMEGAVEEIVASLDRGEKPFITVANTMGSFIQHYAEEHDLKPGDAMGLNFGSLLKRYLERSREVLIGKPYQEKIRHYLTDEELGETGIALYNQVLGAIDATDWSEMPISPIDFLKHKLKEKGYRIGEITGRHHIVDYSGGEGVTSGTPVYKLRSSKEISTSGRNKTLMGYNNGTLDALIVNQAGSTGLSAHASEKFKDQRKRYGIVAQPERNIDTVMQLFGRINRTGQVVKPGYLQLVADIPAEKRPAAVLLKKMASLNANTTASRGGALTAKEIVDFMNEYGDEVVASVLEDDPELHAKLGTPLKHNDQGTGLTRQDAIRRATGRIPLLPIKEQEALYEQIESEYTDLITRLEAMGENTLEAKTLELDAIPKTKLRVFEGEGTSPFARGADAEEMEVKRLGKPMTPEQILESLNLHFETQGQSFADLQRAGRKELGERLQGIKQRFIDYRDNILDQIEDLERLHAQETRLNGLYERLTGTLARVPVGATVRLESNQGHFYGIVTKIQQKGAPKNPVALGSWRVSIAVADGMRQITVAASKIVHEQPETFEGLGANLIVNGAERVREHDNMPVLDYFERAQTESRETRTIVTGNLLAGYSRFRKGQIINFRDHENNIRQGILMPRSFNTEQAMQDEPVAFESAQHVLSFLGSVDGMVETGNGVMKISRTGGTYFFNVPSSKAVGGRYFLDTRILEAAGGEEFVKSGLTMRLRVDRDAATRVLDALLRDGAVLNTKSHKDVARSITGRQEPQRKTSPPVFGAGEPPAEITGAPPRKPPGGGTPPKAPPTGGEEEERPRGKPKPGAPIAASLAQRGGATGTGFAGWFRGRRAMGGQFVGLRAAYDVLTGGARQTVLEAWDRFKDAAVRNLSKLERESPEAHTAALRAGGSRGQATVLLQLATRKIDKALKGSGINWDMVRGALVESRLRGIRERYLDLSNDALDASDEDLADAMGAGLIGVLQHIEGRADFDDTLAQRATALLVNEDFDALRSFLAGTFEEAADHVGRVAMGPDPNAFETLTGNSHFQKALRLYKELIERPVAESHAINEGVFSDALGPLNTYYPLVATKADGSILHRIFGATKVAYRKPRNIANYFATGLAEHGYSLEMKDFADRLRAALRTNNKAALLKELHGQGLIRLLGRFEKGAETINIDGVDYKAGTVDTGTDLLIVSKEGKDVHLPAARAVVPNWLRRELKPILERDRFDDPSIYESIINKVNSFALVGPLDLVFHSTNVLGTLTANTPFIGDSLFSKTVGNLPFTKWINAIVQVARADPMGEESIKDLMEMAKIGLIPSRFGSRTFSKKYAELTGVKRTILSAGPLLYGPSGLDVRARLVMWRAAKQINPNASPQELFKFVSQLGVYVRELESSFERALKQTGLAPFVTAGSTMLRNGIHAWLGTGPLPASGKAKRAAYRLAMLLSGGAAGMILLWAIAYKKYRDEWPWEDPEARLLQIPLKQEHRMSKAGQMLYGPDPTKTGYVNFSFFSPLVSRGSRALGLAGAFETRQLGGSRGQQLEYAQRDIINSFFHPVTSGPLVRAPFVFITGKDPSLTGLRDVTGTFGPQFYPATVKAAPGMPQLARRGEEAVFNINPFFKTGAGAIGLGHEAERQNNRQANRWLRMVTDIVVPRLVGSSIDVVAKKERLAKELKASTPKTGAVKSEKLPDDVRMELHKHEIIPSTPTHKEKESAADYESRTKAGNEEIAARVRALVLSDSYKSGNEEQKRTALKEVIKASRHDSSTAPKGETEPERTLRVRVEAEEDRVRLALEQNPKFQSLSSDQQKQVHLLLNLGLRRYSMDAAERKLPETERVNRATSRSNAFTEFLKSGQLDYQVEQAILRARRKAA